MQWANIAGHEDARNFDRLIAQMQVALLRNSSRFDDLRDDLVNQVSSLPINLSQVKVKLPIIEKAKSHQFWDRVSLDLHDLLDYFPETAGHLDQAIRSVIGMDAQTVHERFTQFVQEHSNLASHQIKFLDLLQNHIAKYGSIEVERLYEPPFTLLHTDSLDGLFDEPLADELLRIIGTFHQSRSDERR